MQKLNDIGRCWQIKGLSCKILFSTDGLEVDGKLSSNQHDYDDYHHNIYNLPHFNLQFMSRWTVCLKGALMLLFLTTQVNSECKSDLNINTEN